MAPVVERRKKIQFAKGNVYDGSKTFDGYRWVEDKFDGLRGGVGETVVMQGIDKQIVVRYHDAFTLTGLPIPNAKHICSEITASGQFEGMVLDGEFKAKDWNESQSIVKTLKDHPDALNLNFYVFDIIPQFEWRTHGVTAPLEERKADLAKRLRRSVLPHVFLVEHKLVFNHDQVIAARNEAVARGLEGVMLKDPSASYSYRKSSAWLKCKPINEADFYITGAVVGRGKNACMLGALQIMNEDLGVECEVGTGFDDLTRQQLWADYLNGRLIGRVVQVEYQEVTEDNALRFPSFIRMRDDKETV